MFAVFTFNHAGIAEAQSFSEPSNPNVGKAGEIGTDARIQILTRPNGALVFLEGEYTLAGRTPYTITYYLKGAYHLRAIKPGYENWSTEYFFNGKGEDKLTIKLKPKTRLKAVTRSVFLPGWGQVYADQRTKGFLIGVLQLGAAGILIYQDSRYTEALNNYNAALQNYRANQNSLEGQQELIAQVKARRADLDNAYEWRKRWLIVTGSIYLYNLLDVMLFFPSYHNRAVEVGLSLNPPPGANGAVVGLNVNAKF
ncbi:MAG: DUF5683 domain-containing protein [candidate division KSB1 bacterium]|nr:DUF5683 domain-containing protein [candidate division KSB1 bacterium]MDZ7302302.1 DUF5683 domain-containing protein [candidate division KSB1 bacterium]MDZ7311408.1 DUF5683 domain-containing protein [candidate division KSB1 bacterium]